MATQYVDATAGFITFLYYKRRNADTASCAAAGATTHLSKEAARMSAQKFVIVAGGTVAGCNTAAQTLPVTIGSSPASDYPFIKTVDKIDEGCYRVRVADAHRWLENSSGDCLHAGVETQNQLAQSALASANTRAVIEKRLSKLRSGRRDSVLFRIGKLRVAAASARARWQ